MAYLVVRAESLLEQIGAAPITKAASLSVDEGGWYTYEVVTATSDEAISLVGVTTASAFFLYSDQTITYVLNGADTAITLTARGWVLLWNTSITACTISNASGSTANVTVGIWGT